MEVARIPGAVGLLGLLAVALTPVYGQMPKDAGLSETVTMQNAAAAAGASAAQGLAQSPAVEITLDEAIARARKNEPNFAAAVAQSKVAGLEHGNAIAALLPGVVYHNQYLYTQPQVFPPGTVLSPANPPVPRFIANNALREYVSQGVATETLSLQQAAAVAETKAVAEAAKAQLEVARRGLVAAVVTLYYNVGTTANKRKVAEQAVREAEDFLNVTKQREAAREAAHADVIKAELGVQQRQRDLSDAELAAENARLELGVLLFADPGTKYSLANDATALPMEAQGEFLADANQRNPSVLAAAATLHAAQMGVQGARAGYLPTLTLNAYYGIDAAQFALNGPNGERNLGYAAMATLDIPVWDWLTTHRIVREKSSIRAAAKVALTAAQRRLVADTDEAWSEARVAKDQLASLEESRQTAQESLRLTRMRYAAGEATVLEVVDAEASYILAANAREDGILRYQTAIANLQILTGKL